jgi:acetyltransferase-like isoleucine patch superfamily enzyme
VCQPGILCAGRWFSDARDAGWAMRLLDKVLKPMVARLVAECIEEERVDALYRYRVHSDPARLTIHPTAVVNNAIFNTGGGRITVGEYVFFGHNVCVLAGVHEVDKFGLERQRAIPRSGYDVEIGEGAWLATNVMVAGPVKIGAHAVVGGGSVVRKDVEPYAVVAGNPARLIRYLTPPPEHRQQQDG